MSLQLASYPFFPTRIWKGHRKSAPKYKFRIYDDSDPSITLAWVGYRPGTAWNRFGIPRSLHKEFARVLGRAPRYVVISGYVHDKDLNQRSPSEIALVNYLFLNDICDVAVHSTLCAVTERLKHVIKDHLKDPEAWLLPPGSPNFNPNLREISMICFEMEAFIQQCLASPTDPVSIAKQDLIAQGEVDLRYRLKGYKGKDVTALVDSVRANTFDVKDLKFMKSSSASGCITVVCLNPQTLSGFVPTQGRRLGDGKAPSLSQLLRYKPDNSVMTVPEAKVFYSQVCALR